MKKGLLAVILASAALGVGGVTYSTCMLTQVNARMNEVAIKLADAKGEGEDVLKQLWEELVKFKDNTLIPLLGGSAGVCLVVPLVTAIFNYLRTKKVVSNLKLTDEELEKVQDFVTKGSKVLEDCQKIIASNEEIKKIVGNLLIKVNEAVESNENVSKSLTLLKSVVVLLIELETKVASVSENAIANGIVDQVNQINEIAAKL